MVEREEESEDANDDDDEEELCKQKQRRVMIAKKFNAVSGKAECRSDLYVGSSV